MSPAEDLTGAFSEFAGENIVVDTRSPFVYIGRLERVSHNALILSDADVHNINETSTSTGRYLLETQKHGIRINRRSVTVLVREIVSISRLNDIEPY
ncbi:MAG: hypothetical protein ACLFWL_06760 [Candidatus Brocadiia bacterium]